MNKIAFVVACVNEFGKKLELSPKEAFMYLYNHEAIKFLTDNYEAEHTISFDVPIPKIPSYVYVSIGNFPLFAR